MNYYQNPLSHDTYSADPCILYDEVTGYYYYLYTQHIGLTISRARHLRDFPDNCEKREIFHAEGNCGVYDCLWAPELHRHPDGSWYIYTSGTYSTEHTKKGLFCIHSKTTDPFGEWEFGGFLTKGTTCIDPSVYFDKKGQQWICFTTVTRNHGQPLVIAKMKSPTEMAKTRKFIAKATLPWELVPPYIKRRKIVEGPYFVENDKHLFIVYSANGCYSDDYCLGVLELVGDDMLNPKSWKKLPQPVLTKGNGVYGPGHATFFRSPDGTELWCAYHTLPYSNPHPGEHMTRRLNAQKVEFDENGYIIPMQTVPHDVDYPAPSGEIE
jgi:GH43 family beta-xylosidase